MGESGHCIWLMLYRVAACIFYCCCMQWVYSYRISSSRKIHFMSHDSSSINIEFYSNRKIHRLLKLPFFITN